MIVMLSSTPGEEAKRSLIDDYIVRNKPPVTEVRVYDPISMQNVDKERDLAERRKRRRERHDESFQSDSEKRGRRGEAEGNAPALSSKAYSLRQQAIEYGASSSYVVWFGVIQLC